MSREIITYILDSNKEDLINGICKNARGKTLGLYLEKSTDADCKDRNYFPELSVENNIIYYQKLYGDNSSSTDKILSDFGLVKVRKSKAKKIGEKNSKKLSIAITFIGNPICVVLENPFENLGVETSSSIKKVIIEYVKKNSAQIVIIANKLMEYEDISDTVFCVKDNVVEKIKGATL